MKKALFILLSLTVLAILNYGIYEKEQLKAHGETVYLKIAPVDPRSLMQGDYMQLRYAIEDDLLRMPADGHKERGYVVIAIDDKHKASFVRFYSGEPLQPGEKLLHYHRNNYGSVRIVPDSFMFQEGQSEFYRVAKYGKFKFDKKGDHILVGLADENLQDLKPPVTTNGKKG
jgi:uncharacterized membrane-anchored protein